MTDWTGWYRPVAYLTFIALGVYGLAPYVYAWLLYGLAVVAIVAGVLWVAVAYDLS